MSNIIYNVKVVTYDPCSALKTSWGTKYLRCPCYIKWINVIVKWLVIGSIGSVPIPIRRCSHLEVVILETWIKLHVILL